MIPAIFFTVDVAHAVDLSTVLRNHGVRVYPVSGKTPKDERRRLLEMARSGEIDGLASCDALTTGFDSPISMMAVMARPTASGLWYRQAVGRILRPYPAPQGERPYQSEALRAIYRTIQRGVLNQLLVLPTGTGKTVIMARLPETVLRYWRTSEWRGRILFLVHRDELADQTVATFARYNPAMKIGVEKADSYAPPDSDLVVGSVQTIGPAKKTGDNPRLTSLDPSRFSCVITDEAHFGAASQMYTNIYRHMGVLKNAERRDPNVLHLGITATPNRHDGLGLEKHYDEISYVFGLNEAIQQGWLCRIVGYRAETTVDISKVQMRGEDLAVAELEKTVNTPERNELIARKYLEICEREGNHVQGWTPPKDWVKPHAIVLDCADLSGQHSLISLPTLFGLSSKFNAKGQDVMQQADKVREIQAKHPNLDLRQAQDMDAIDATLRSVDLLAPPVVPAEIHGKSRFAWLADGPGSYHMGCMDKRVLTVRQNVLGQWEVYEHKAGIAKHLDTSKDLREALRIAEKTIPANLQKVLPVGAAWRSDPPTDRQAARVWDLDVRVRREYATPRDYFQFCQRRYQAGDFRYGKGGLSNMIDALDPSRLTQAG